MNNFIGFSLSPLAAPVLVLQSPKAGLKRGPQNLNQDSKLQLMNWNKLGDN